MGAPIGQRNTVRATSNGVGIYRPTAQVLPQGASEMALVITGKLRSASITGQILIDHRSVATVDGFVAFFTGGTLSWICGTGAAGVQQFTRAFQASDVGRLTRFVCKCSVVENKVQTYVNAIPQGSSAINAYSAGTPTAQTFLDSGFGGAPGAVTDFECIDLALLQGATFSDSDVRDLDRAILAAGRVPPSFARWQMLYQIDALLAHPTALDAGGLSAGLGLVRVGGAGVLGAFDQTLATSWGPGL